MKDDQIFELAIDIQDTFERERFVLEQCQGDASRYALITRLTESCLASGEFMAQPACNQGITNRFARIEEDSTVWKSEKPGDSIGPFELINEIGRGGMAIVFRAKQSRPIHRMVAIKIIKPGLETEQLVSRMEFERQALAMMNHNGIANVYDAGVTPLGRPYFVMELVDGVPITDFCQRECLTQRQRIELIVDICDSVEHAHRRGIIHRDIKPSNILVCRDNDKLVAKIIDFGIAKMLTPERGRQETLTALGQIVGTPQYMSPEQASSDNMDVDTRSDVYSLGAVLYELITGKPPVESATLVETLNRIANDEPVPPSRINRSIGRDLETICLCCLMKDPDRRYGTPRALAEDLTRAIQGRPIKARPLGPVGRVGKWARRSPAAAGLAGVLILGIALLVSLWAVLTMQLKNQRDQIQAVATQLETEKSFAIENFGRAHKAIRKYLDTLRSHTPFGSTRDLIFQQQMLETAIEFYDELVENRNENEQLRASPRLLAELRLEQANLYMEYGKVMLSARDAMESIRSFNTALVLLNGIKQDGMQDSGKIIQSLGVAHTSLSKSFVRANQLQKAEQAARESIRCYQRLAKSDSLDSGNKNWYLALGWNRLGEVLLARGKTEETILAFRRARHFGQRLTSIYDFQLTYARSCLGLGQVYRQLGKPSQALEELQKGKKIIESVCIRSTPTLPRYIVNRVQCITEIAHCQHDSQQIELALDSIDNAIKLQSELFDLHADAEQFGFELADLYDLKGEWLNDPRTRASAFAESKRIIQQIGRRSSSPSQRLIKARMLLDGIGSDINRLNYSRAANRLEETLTLVRGIDPAHQPQATNELLTGIHYNLALMRFQLADYESAKQHFEDFDRLGGAASDQDLIVYAVCLAELGDYLLAAKEIIDIDPKLPSPLFALPYLPLIRLHGVLDSYPNPAVKDINKPLQQVRQIFSDRESLSNVQYRSLAYSLCRMIELLEKRFPNDATCDEFTNWARQASIECIRNLDNEKNTRATRAIFNDKRIAILSDMPELKQLNRELNPQR